MNQPFACAVLAATLFASCSSPGFSLEPRYGKLEAEGDLALTDVGSTLVVQNSLEDLGIAGDEPAAGLRADLTFAWTHITFATEGAEWSGTGVVSDFGGIAGTNVAVDSDLELAVHRAVLTFDVLPFPAVELGLGFGVTALDIKASVTDPLTSSEDVDNFLPIPVLSVRFGVDVWRLEFEALVSGMSVDIDGNKATLLDTDLSARLRLFGLGPVDAFLSAGYRRVDVDAEYEDGGDRAEADVTFDGPYFGLKFSV